MGSIGSTRLSSTKPSIFIAVNVRAFGPTPIVATLITFRLGILKPSEVMAHDGMYLNGPLGRFGS